MSERIDSPEYAARLARAIAADLVLYNDAEIRRGREQGDVLGAVQKQIAEGRNLFLERVTADIAAMGLFEQAIGEALGVSPPPASLPPPVRRTPSSRRAPLNTPTAFERQNPRRSAARHTARPRVLTDGPKGDSGRGKYRTAGRPLDSPSDVHGGPKGGSGRGKYRTTGKSATKYKKGAGSGGLWLGMLLVIGAVGALIYVLLH